MAKYNESVRNIFGLNPLKGEVGIEIEMEGRGLIHGPIGNWRFHADGSLRGEDNAEYVLGVPVRREAVADNLSQLFNELKNHGAKIRKDSPNTSVHVHLNMLEWSMKKAYTFICVWYIFESLLLDWCGEERVGNLFCLRGSDAEVALQRLASAVRYSRYQQIGDQDGLRYTAMNYTALAKFGSLEFRSLAGVYDEETINLWVRVLLSLKDFAEKYDSPPEIIQEFSRSGAEDFLHMALPGDLWKKVYNAGFKKQMQEGMRLIQGVAYCVNWEKADQKKSLMEKPDEGLENEIDIDRLNDVEPDHRLNGGRDWRRWIDRQNRPEALPRRVNIPIRPLQAHEWRDAFDVHAPQPPMPEAPEPDRFLEAHPRDFIARPGGWLVNGHEIGRGDMEQLENGNFRVRIRG